MITISIALATFNGERYLKSQLESLADQTTPPAELVVSDDGSSDGTIAIVQDFARTVPFPVRVFQNSIRLGHRANFMKAAKLCASELIAFCDQDDIWEQNKLATMQRQFADSSVLLAYHNSTLIDEVGTITGTTFSKRLHSRLFESLTILPWAIVPGHAQVMRKSLIRFTPLHIKSLDPYNSDERMPHDQWYLFWASALGKIAYVCEPLVRYRQHEHNTTGWPHPNLLTYVLDHIRNAEKYVTGDSIGMANRLALLSASQDLIQPNEIEQIRSAISYYEAQCILTAERAKVFTDKSLLARAQHFFALIRQNAYAGRETRRLGFDALLLDIFIGILLSRIGRMPKRHSYLLETDQSN